LYVHFVILEQHGSILICVSPFNAKFAPTGIETEFADEEQSDPISISKVVDGQIQLFYISPENLICNPMYRNMLLSPMYKEKLVGLVVDEALRIKTW
jgi:bloom syndrome protein